jgi:hypothetical protein
VKHLLCAHLHPFITHVIMQQVTPAVWPPSGLPFLPDADHLVRKTPNVCPALASSPDSYLLAHLTPSDLSQALVSLLSPAPGPLHVRLPGALSSSPPSHYFILSSKSPSPPPDHPDTYTTHTHTHTRTRSHTHLRSHTNHSLS